MVRGVGTALFTKEEGKRNENWRRMLSRTAGRIAPMISGNTYALPSKPELTRALGREVERAQRYERPLTLYLLSVVGLRTIESTYGAYGVLKLLQTLHDRGQALVRGGDLFGHWQGDMFVLAMSETTLQDSVGGLTRLQMELGRYHTKAGNITFDVGATALDTQDSIPTLLTKADERLHQQRMRRREQVWQAQVTLWIPTGERETLQIADVFAHCTLCSEPEGETI